MPVEVDVAQERLRQAAETVLYFTIAEALTYLAKYADATHARASPWSSPTES